MELCACVLTLTVATGTSRVVDDEYVSMDSGNDTAWGAAHPFLFLLPYH